MKKSGMLIFLVITLVFAAFCGGFYLGRNTGGSPILLQSPQQSNSASSASIEKININTCTAEDLQTLPGIGPALAQRIIDYRSKHGYFSSVADLAKVEGIAESRLEILWNYITV